MPGPPGGQVKPWEVSAPPERHFPIAVVITHGILALTTVTLVVLTILDDVLRG